MPKPRRLPEKTIVISRLAAMACSDMTRDTIARLRVGSEWRREKRFGLSARRCGRSEHWCPLFGED
jgi:hypothetical protein